jgi:cytoskeletal protein CcmA (bactofilin family)
MAGALNGGHEAPELYVGEGVTINGAAIVAETVVVDGALEGDVSARNLVVRERGTVKGRISVAENAEIFGKVLERLNVRGLLIVRASGRVEGDVSCGTLTIERGANITGEISSSDYRTALHAFTSHRQQDTRPGKAASSMHPLDFSALELPSPIAATA